MTFFDALSLIGGLCLFLFGMNVMGSSLERRAGDSLRTILEKLTTNKFLGFLTGLAVTGVIQSSSATTVMVVGFVNSGLLTLGQAINVIMGANVGTTVTSWILSLSGIDSGNFLIQMMKPSNFSPILALIGIIYFMFFKDDKKKDTGMILLGFATLMFGMDAMSASVAGLKDVPAFRQMFVMFENPILGVLVGALLTAIIQSSSASVGILQALSSTGQISFAAAIPIIMGQNIGTCATAMISSVGTTKNAKRAAFVHLLFNIIGTTVCLILFALVEWLFTPAILAQRTNELGIAVCHTIFNVISTSLLLPMSGVLEKIVCKLVPDAKEPEKVSELDDLLLSTPPVALQRCQAVACDMANCAQKALLDSLTNLTDYTPELSKSVCEKEKLVDHYEDILGTYLVKLSAQKISAADSAEAATLLKAIGDFERISDHSVNLVESAQELNRKGLDFSDSAKQELSVLTGAVGEIIDLSFSAFTSNDLEAAKQVEPLEQVIDDLKEQMRTRHILRLQQGSCSIETGFIWSDLLTNLERTSDHCSNIAGCIIDLHHRDLNTHQALHSARNDSASFDALYRSYSQKYQLG